MIAHMEDELIQVTLEDMEETWQRVFAAADKKYKEFFWEMENFIADAVHSDDTPPSSIRPYMAGTFWQELSTNWHDKKRIRNGGTPLGFYHGVTKFGDRRSRSFYDWSSNLVGNTRMLEKFFGKPLMQFDVSKAGRSFTVTSNGTKVKYKRVGPMQSEKPFTKAENKKTYTIRVVIVSFPKLLGAASAQWSEWKFVDAMISAVGRGSSTAKQLRKINGTKAFGGSRSVRPLIIPVIVKQLQKIKQEINRSL